MEGLQIEDCRLHSLVTATTAGLVSRNRRVSMQNAFVEPKGEGKCELIVNV
jgi:hypothetical protein